MLHVILRQPCQSVRGITKCVGGPSFEVEKIGERRDAIRLDDLLSNRRVESEVHQGAGTLLLTLGRARKNDRHERADGASLGDQAQPVVGRLVAIRRVGETRLRRRYIVALGTEYFRNLLRCLTRTCSQDGVRCSRAASESRGNCGKALSLPLLPRNRFLSHPLFLRNRVEARIHGGPPPT